MNGLGIQFKILGRVLGFQLKPFTAEMSKKCVVLGMARARGLRVWVTLEVSHLVLLYFKSLTLNGSKVRVRFAIYGSRDIGF